jgi:ABC-type uncharacterized transport system involved in gliding motility auxiliary subunit
VARAALTAASQRWRVLLALPPLLGIFGVGQAILDRRAIRLDLTPEQRYTLSEHAERILDGLTTDVRVLAFLRSQDPRNPRIRDLLRQVAARSPHVHVDAYDVNRSPALARQYRVDSYGALVVESEGRRRVFSNPSEEIFMAAILQVTRQQRKTVGWVLGHGEGDLTSNERYRGFSTARALLEQEYYEVRPVSLMGDDVPPEVDVLVIAGPQKDYLPEELGALDRYLQRPGQGLVMLDPQRAPELARFLSRYDVLLGPDVVVDPAARLYGGESVTMEVPVSRGIHPITDPLQSPALFSLTRSVRVGGEGEGRAGIEFLRTSDDSWATTDTDTLTKGTARYVPGRDRRGPIPVGVEVAFVPVGEPGVEPTQGRLVVYGNSEFAGNFFIEFLGNRDLFVDSVQWLARQPQGMAHHNLTQALGVQQFFVSADQGAWAFWLAAVIEPGLFAAVGLALAARRRWG